MERFVSAKYFNETFSLIFGLTVIPTMPFLAEIILYITI